MDYFDDLNPYLVKEDDNENLIIPCFGTGITKIECSFFTNVNT